MKDNGFHIHVQGNSVATLQFNIYDSSVLIFKKYSASTCKSYKIITYN